MQSMQAKVLPKVIHSLVVAVLLVAAICWSVKNVSAQQLPPPPPLPNKPVAGQSAAPLPLPMPQAPPQGSMALPSLDNRGGGELQQQSQGQFPIMERSGSMPLGALQRAWDAPYSASGQTAPGVMRYVWRPDFVMAVRTREYMATTLYFPEWERISDIVVGDQVAFELQRVRPNIVALRPVYPGADTNVTALGLSGNLYSFYVRSEGFNSDQISDFAVYVYANAPAGVRTGGGEGGGYGSAAPASAGSAPASGGGAGAGGVSGGSAGGSSGGGASLSPGTGGGVGDSWLDKHGLNSGMAMSAGIIPPDYIREIAFRPENLQFNMKIFAPTAADAEIAPMRVFHDGIWTYFDFGEKADLVRRPVVYRVVDGVDSMVNTRTAGVKGNVLVAEAVGDFTMKNGDRTLCIFRSDVPRPQFVKKNYNYDPSEAQVPGVPGLPSQLQVGSGYRN
jgi:type IV secretory pathway VirB9-like protein